MSGERTEDEERGLGMSGERTEDKARGLRMSGERTEIAVREKHKVTGLTMKRNV